MASTRYSALTRAQLLRKRDLFHQYYGPDQAPAVHQFADGWSIRKVNTSHACNYEGELMGNCVGSAKSMSTTATEDYHKPDDYDFHYMSLRDPDNLPHATFAWSADASRFGDLDIEGRHGSNPDKYIPYISHWWTNVLGRRRPGKNFVDEAYEANPKALDMESDAFKNAPVDTFRDQQASWFWRHDGPMPTYFSEKYKRARRPIRKADQMVTEHGKPDEEAEFYLRNKLMHHFKDHEVDMLVNDWKRALEEDRKRLPEAVDKQVPPRHEWPEFFYMAKKYGQDVYDIVHDAQKIFRAMSWNPPEFTAHIMRERITDELGEPDIGDRVAKEWLAAMDPGADLRRSNEEEMEARIKEQAQAIKELGSPLSIEEIEMVMRDQERRRQSSERLPIIPIQTTSTGEVNIRDIEHRRPFVVGHDGIYLGPWGAVHNDIKDAYYAQTGQHMMSKGHGYAMHHEGPEQPGEVGVLDSPGHPAEAQVANYLGPDYYPYGNASEDFRLGSHDANKRGFIADSDQRELYPNSESARLQGLSVVPALEWRGWGRASYQTRWDFPAEDLGGKWRFAGLSKDLEGRKSYISKTPFVRDSSQIGGGLPKPLQITDWFDGQVRALQPWQPGSWGKGLIDDDGQRWAWQIEGSDFEDHGPHHVEVSDALGGGFTGSHIWIKPDGEVQAPAWDDEDEHPMLRWRGHPGLRTGPSEDFKLG